MGALAEWQAADTVQQNARDRLRTVGRFGKRRATREHRTAQTLARDAEQRVTSAWGEPPSWHEKSAAWVERVTRPTIDSGPRVTEAAEQQQVAAAAVRKTLGPDDLPRLRIYSRIFGTKAVAKNRAAYPHARPHANAGNQARTAQQAAPKSRHYARSPRPKRSTESSKPATEQAARDADDHALRERQLQLRFTSHTRDSDLRQGGPAPGR